jgi:hypothetical protein
MLSSDRSQRSRGVGVDEEFGSRDAADDTFCGRVTRRDSDKNNNFAPVHVELLRATKSCAKLTYFMRKGPKRSFHKDISRITNSTLRQTRETTQHGLHTPLLLCLPSESLTYITSFLDPVSLCSLAQTSRKLYQHVGDDNTWRRAFVCQVLGILPEEDLNEVRPLTFRSTQKTWRHEFERRHIIRG